MWYYQWDCLYRFLSYCRPVLMTVCWMLLVSMCFSSLLYVQLWHRHFSEKPVFVLMSKTLSSTPVITHASCVKYVYEQWHMLNETVEKSNNELWTYSYTYLPKIYVILEMRLFCSFFSVVLSACPNACLLNVACLDVFPACCIYNYDIDIFQGNQFLSSFRERCFRRWLLPTLHV
jgi:hypothetical protein